jgi:glycoside/pentoside/hexuronide:cation symporter, GPH family
MNNKTNKSKEIFLYGILGIPIAFLGFPLYIYLPTFYVEYIGLNIGIVGLVLLIARVIDMILDPFIGRITDKYNNFNLILIFSFIILIGLYFLIKPIYFTSLWLFSFSLLTYISYSFIMIPYLTLNSKLSTNSIDNTKLAFSREIFIIIGVLTALLMPYIFLISKDSQKSLELLLNTILIIFPIFSLIFYFKLKNKEKKKDEKKKEDFLKSINIFFNNFPEHKKLFIAFLLNNLANALPATLFLFFVKHILDLEEETGIFLIVYFLSAIVTFPLWIKLSLKLSKKTTWILSMIIACVTFAFVPFLNHFDFSYFIIICILTGMCLGADMALPSSIQADVAQQSKKNNNDISGILFGFWAMITKFSLAFAVAISFITLEFTSFDTKSVNENSLIAIVILYSILPIILKLLSIILLSKYKLT